MADIPAPTDPTLNVIDDIISALIYSVGVNAAITAATVKFPWLGLPIVSNLFRYIVTLIGSRIFEAMKPFVDMNVIKFQNAAQQQMYDNAVMELKQAQESGDTDARQKAIDDFKSRFDKLVTFGPVSLRPGHTPRQAVLRYLGCGRNAL